MSGRTHCSYRFMSGKVQHALDALNAASDKMMYGDSGERDLLDAHATLDSLLAAETPEPEASEG